MVAAEVAAVEATEMGMITIHAAITTPVAIPMGMTTSGLKFCSEVGRTWLLGAPETRRRTLRGTAISCAPTLCPLIQVHRVRANRLTVEATAAAEEATSTATLAVAATVEEATEEVEVDTAVGVETA